MRLALAAALAGALALPAAAQDRRVERTGPAPAASSGPAKKVALVVGNDAYARATPLKNAVNDARAVGSALQGLGFQAEVVANGDRTGFERAVNRFVSALKPGDVALFYYAGHGLQIEGENYLVPVDFAAEDEVDAKYQSYPAGRVLERMEAAGAKLNVIVLDACRDNPFKSTRSGAGGLAAMQTGRGALIAFATSPGKTAADNPKGSNGLFTTHLVAALKEPGLSLDQVFNRVRAKVYEESGNKQLPWTNSSVIGEYYLNPAAAPAGATGGGAPPATTAARPVQGLLSGQAVVVSGSAPASVPSRPPAATPGVNAGAADLAIQEGLRLMQRGDALGALQQFDRATQANPASAAALLRRGEAYARLGRVNDALADLNKALRLDPRSTDAYVLRGQVLGWQGQVRAAIEDFSEVLRLQPQHKVALVLRGSLYVRDGRLDEAGADLDAALRLDPRDALAYLERGMLRRARKDFAGARADLDTALQLQPSGPNASKAYRERGNVHSAQGRLEEAVADLTAAIRANPQYAQAYADRAEVYNAMGNKAAAEADLQQAQIVGKR